ncbi:MAG: tryptophan synthase subunit alpha [Candidatus Omnitrophica bacterium]|nr:tryptophan synthase subunit alpha [Candidatus Omnitrophota bacterium]
MTRITQAFTRLKKAGQSAFIPYLTAGYPNTRTCLDLIRTLEDQGADIIEIGIPFSDPLADGPTIQKASTQALAAGMTAQKAMDLAAQVRKRSGIPIVMMTYYNIVARRGLAHFMRQARAAGVDGLICADLPPEEAGDLIPAARAARIDTIFLAAPTSSADRLRRINRVCRGFLYYVSITGTTGARADLPADLTGQLDRVRHQSRLPVCVGFGVSKQEQVRRLRRHADGIIVGSAVVKSVEGKKGAAAVNALKRFVRPLIKAAHGE